MANESNNIRTPKRGPGGFGGPGMRGGKGEKAKDFKSAILRLFRELNKHRVLIAVALILAVFSSILSIFAPNKLSELTDEISEGLVVNQANMETLANIVKNSLSDEKMQDVMPKILEMNLSQDVVSSIMMNADISFEDKQIFQNTMTKIGTTNDQSEIFEYLLELPNSILKIILPTSTYEETVISSEDKIELLKTLNNLDSDNMQNITLPESIQNVLLKEVEIDGVKISSQDQYKFLTAMSSLSEDVDVNVLY